MPTVADWSDRLLDLIPFIVGVQLLDHLTIDLDAPIPFVLPPKGYQFVPNDVEVLRPLCSGLHQIYFEHRMAYCKACALEEPIYLSSERETKEYEKPR